MFTFKSESAKHKQVKDCMAPNGFSEKYHVDELVLKNKDKCQRV